MRPVLTPTEARPRPAGACLLLLVLLCPGTGPVLAQVAAPEPAVAEEAGDADVEIPEAMELPWFGPLPELVPPPTAPLGVAPALEEVRPGESLALGLREAIALALARNPALKAIEERLDEVVGGIDEARADALPQLALVSSWGSSRNPSFLNSPDFEQILDQFPGGDFEPSVQRLFRISTEISQPIYTFGKLGAAIELARTVGLTVEAQIEAARLETALLAAEAYYDVLAARRALGVIEAQDRARRAALEVVQARYDIGEATRLELLRSQSALAELGPEIADLRGDLEVAEGRLRLALGLPPTVALDVEESAELDAAGAPVEAMPVPPSLAQLVARARESRPELAELLAQQEVLLLQQQIVRAEGRPQVELTGRYGREARLVENITDPLFTDWAATVGLRWEFFDGGRRRGQIAQLESQRQQRAWELADLENQIVLQIETALASYRAARAREEAARTSAETAREATRVAEETYREGVTLQSDLLDAQEREVEAEILLVDATYEALLEAARLARAVGRLPTAPLAALGAPSAPDTPTGPDTTTTPGTSER